MKAQWNGTIIAESDDTIVVEGNHYFPADAVDPKFLIPSETTTTCGWKGIASYYSIKVGETINKDAVWYYPNPKDAAQNIAGRLAFWKGVVVS